MWSYDTTDSNAFNLFSLFFSIKYANLTIPYQLKYEIHIDANSFLFEDVLLT